MASLSRASSRWRSVPGVLIAAVVAAFWWRRAPSAGTLALVAVTGALVPIALVLPRVYAPVQNVVEAVAGLLARAVTLLILGLVFAVVFVPGRLVLALRRSDPLHRSPDPGRTTYWTPIRPTTGAERFRRQF